MRGGKKPKSKNENDPSPPWIELPEDVTANILQRLGLLDTLEGAQYVCTTWRRICSDPAMWRVLHLKHDDFWADCNLDLWRRAVDRSQGQLVDLTIQHDSCDDALLKYICDRSSDIKRLTLKDCYRCTVKALVKSGFNRLPHLEELRIIYLPKIKASDIVNIGISCPALKSFTFNPHGSKFWHAYSACNLKNEHALAIAKNMPNLRHLRLVSNLITNEGLEAILDGCPKLESLDLRMCPELDLRGALGKKCSEKIKHVEFPLEAVSLVKYHRALVVTCEK